jgi:hypothetical protein
MTSLTIHITDEVARALAAEAGRRRISVEELAAERLAVSPGRSPLKPTPARPPLRTDDPESILGAYADRPDLLDRIEVVMEDRARRYAGSE